jgi:hypothetical protein
LSASCRERPERRPHGAETGFSPAGTGALGSLDLAVLGAQICWKGLVAL